MKILVFRHLGLPNTWHHDYSLSDTADDTLAEHLQGSLQQPELTERSKEQIIVTVF